MTEVGSIIGTAQYLSPEQARGAPVGPTSDIYSVGVVLYEMLTGEVPFTGDTPLEIAMKHLSAIPDPPSQQEPGRPARPRPDRAPRAREEPEEPLPVGRGDGRRPRARRPRPRGQRRDRERGDDGARRRGRRRLGADDGHAAAAPVTPRPAGAAARRPPATTATRSRRAGARSGRGSSPCCSSRPRSSAAGSLTSRSSTSWRRTSRCPCRTSSGSSRTSRSRRSQDAGLTPQRRCTPPTATVPTGNVIGQDPGGGNRIDKGNTVDALRLQRASRRSIVPDVRGKTENDAIATLADANLKCQGRARSSPTSRRAP